MTKKTLNRFPPEVQQRAMRMVLEHGGDHGSQWAARRPFESAQYVSIRYTERLAGWDRAVGRQLGDGYDNAIAETIIGPFKTEVIHRRGPWRSLDAVEFAVLEWVDWFNNSRLLEPIGNMPPADAEERYYAELQETALAA